MFGQITRTILGIYGRTYFVFVFREKKKKHVFLYISHGFRIFRRRKTTTARVRIVYGAERLEPWTARFATSYIIRTRVTLLRVNGPANGYSRRHPDKLDNTHRRRLSAALVLYTRATSSVLYTCTGTILLKPLKKYTKRHDFLKCWTREIRVFEISFRRKPDGER